MIYSRQNLSNRAGAIFSVKPNLTKLREKAAPTTCHNKTIVADREPSVSHSTLIELRWSNQAASQSLWLS
jgi:hypothetical protein